MIEEVSKLDELTKWNGWGYRDSYFYVHKNEELRFVGGNRYELNGKSWPDFVEYSETQGMILSPDHLKKSKDAPDFIPEPIKNEKLMKFLQENNITHSVDGMHRVNRSHGHSLSDIALLRFGKSKKRIPDIVVWPKCNEDVVKIVSAANCLNVAIIPYGGGTNVSGALTCPVYETRCIISLDMRLMNKILSVDKETMTCRAECGIVGVDLEKQLAQQGFTVGHIPDSIEFSTLGGWVAMRASGMKRNKYGNIEDLVVHLKMVTSKGVISKDCTGPAQIGPDINHFVLGSEGTLGVITEVTVKICNAPKRRYGSMLFPNLESGVAFLREVARQKIKPASLRLFDNVQFKAGQALVLKRNSLFKELEHYLIWSVFIPYWFRFNPDEMCGTSIVYEGTIEEINTQQTRLNSIAKKFNVAIGDEERGFRGNQLTFYVLYLRDIGLQYSCLAESFETSICWDKILPTIKCVKEVCLREGNRLGINLPIHISARITQIYDSGVCIYFYLGFTYRNMFPELDEPDKVQAALNVFSQIEYLARKEIMLQGGSISHHHGVGKTRKPFFRKAIGDIALSALQGIKQELDPNNVFACGNMFDVSKI